MYSKRKLDTYIPPVNSSFCNVKLNIDQQFNKVKITITYCTIYIEIWKYSILIYRYIIT